MLIYPNWQGVAGIPVTFLRYTHVRVWEINPVKIQGPATQVKFLQLPQDRSRLFLLKWKQIIVPASRTPFATKS